MSFFSGYNFFVYLVVLLIPAALLGMFEKKLKWYRWIVSAIFIWQVYRSTPIQLLYLLCYVVFTAILVKIYLCLRTKYGRNEHLYGYAVFFALLPLIIYKVGATRGYTIFGFLGISYICFRVIQVLIESYDGVITEINVYQYVGFLLFFPSLSSGPIDRSRRFNEDDDKIWSRTEYSELLSTGIYKLVQGLFYKVVCSGVFFHILQTYFEDKYSPCYLIGYAYVGTAPKLCHFNRSRKERLAASDRRGVEGKRAVRSGGSSRDS